MARTGKLLRAATSCRLAIKKIPKLALSNKRCLAIVNRLGDTYTTGLPWKSQELVKKLKRGLATNGKRHLDAEKATHILGKALREIDAGLQNLVKEAKIVVEGVDDEHANRLSTVTSSETKLGCLQQAVVACSQSAKDSQQSIYDAKCAISQAKARRQTHLAEAKKVESRKRQLETIAQESYEPLKFAAADGPEGVKRLAALRRAGKAYCFQPELLSIAPVILRKPLDSRHTFEDLVVRQLASEFKKNASSLSTNIKNSESALSECTQQLEIAEAQMTAAKEAYKKATRELTFAEAAVVKERMSLAEAKSSVRRLPAEVKRVERSLAQAQARLLKFQRGPRATYERAVGLHQGDTDDVTEAESSEAENGSPVARP